eukprot:TRINITY_DN7378_c0_g1_i1.p1 TRINITY_DN7378_c0_g1~~TRINITY_DN7378_c0_g1_i1.p1  ORF type:complete len:237 (-),score=65.57 TRINITY_DN7378_c0_g1_i1:24-734(-)
MKFRASLVLFALVLVISTVQAKNGVVDLDYWNFDKVVDGNRNVLIHFTEKAWGQINDWTEVATNYQENQDILIATFSAEAADIAENKKIAERFSLTKYPSFLFFPKGSTTPSDTLEKKDAADSIDAVELIEFINVNLNTELKTLRTLAQSFATATDKTSAINQAKKIVEKVTDADLKKYATFFLRSMERIVEKGATFVDAEQKRLTSLITNKSTVDKKRREFKQRLSVLNTFEVTA